ncbi:vomeronasal type-1 receptor 3-like [Dromiciops gliroides]|uniref:vomeronasal type-1 receptor 3-like n=1 Tax=Dromiciops gliroides TaxID=33562 RepID=UPI001CC4B116|nr:vomeronasal type-1 receptor 3-like [Dromiciops gliroides]
MYSYGDILYFLYVLQIMIGILGNVLVLYLYSFHLITGYKTRPIDLIIINLTFSNILTILFRGVPWAIQLLQVKFFLDNIGCKTLIYLQRTSRSLTLCSNCFLSVFQTITISSCNIRWAELRIRAPKYIISCCILIWIFSQLLSVPLFSSVTGVKNNSNSNQSRNLGICSLNRYTRPTSAFISWKSLYEGVFVSVMVISSGYMIFVLYRHHQQVQHTLGTSLTPRASPEIRATKTILLMLSIFLYFYSVSFIFIIYMDNFQDTKQWMLHICVLLTLCYPSFIPYVLISSDSQISNSCYLFQRMKKSCPCPSTSQNKHHKALQLQS